MWWFTSVCLCGRCRSAPSSRLLQMISPAVLHGLSQLQQSTVIFYKFPTQEFILHFTYFSGHVMQWLSKWGVNSILRTTTFGSLKLFQRVLSKKEESFIFSIISSTSSAIFWVVLHTHTEPGIKSYQIEVCDLISVSLGILDLKKLKIHRYDDILISCLYKSVQEISFLFFTCFPFVFFTLRVVKQM